MKKVEKSLIVKRVQKAETSWAAAEYLAKHADKTGSERAEGCKRGAKTAWTEYMVLKSLANDLGIDVPSSPEAATWWQLSNTL